MPVVAGADQPTHQHAVDGSINLPSTSIGLASGCCAGGYAGTGSYPFQATSTLDASGLPFLLAPFCQQTGGSL